MDKFKRLEDRGKVDGTSYHGTEIKATPNSLMTMFGPSESTDEYKIAWEWTFERIEDGMVFTLYDWKNTRTYSKDLPLSETLLDTVIEFHVGSMGGINAEYEFVEWVRMKLKS